MTNIYSAAATLLS